MNTGARGCSKSGKETEPPDVKGQENKGHIEALLPLLIGKKRIARIPVPTFAGLGLGILGTER